MGNKIIIVAFIFLLLGLNSNSQHYFACSFSNAKDSASQDEACLYNQEESFSSVDTAAQQIVIKILNLIPMQPTFDVKRCDGIHTCRAFVWDDGTRYIFYDDNFISKLLDTTKNHWSLIGILAHELGHHFLGHSILSKINDSAHRVYELAADFFAGSMLAKMGATKDQAISCLNEVTHPPCDQEQFNSYPCYENRKKALLNGYNLVQPEQKDKNFEIAKHLETINISTFPKFAINKPLGFSTSHVEKTFFEKDTLFKYNIRFVFIKATDGIFHQDKNVFQNIDIAQKNYLEIYLYHFFIPDLPAEEQAENFLSVFDKFRDKAFAMIDLSDRIYDFKTNQFKLIDKEKFKDSVLKFISILKLPPDKIVLYVNTDFANKYLDTTFSKFKICIARYSKTYDPNTIINSIGKKPEFWQFMELKGTTLNIKNE